VRELEFDFGRLPTARKKAAGGRMPGAWLDWGLEESGEEVGGLEGVANVLGWEKMFLVYADCNGDEAFMLDCLGGEKEMEVSIEEGGYATVGDSVMAARELLRGRGPMGSLFGVDDK